MGPHADATRAYDQLLDLARTLSAAGHYEATYHALMTALHCAEDAGDPARLAEVAGLFRNHQRAVDAIRPPHKLSTQAAHTGRSVFETGAVLAEAEIKRLESQHRLAELRGVGRPPRSGPEEPV
jgi:hypothetical protein